MPIHTGRGSNLAPKDSQNLKPRSPMGVSPPPAPIFLSAERQLRYTFYGRSNSALSEFDYDVVSGIVSLPPVCKRLIRVIKARLVTGIMILILDDVKVRVELDAEQHPSPRSRPSGPARRFLAGSLYSGFTTIPSDVISSPQ